MPDILFIHIVSASFALLGGYGALFARKGSILHRRAGVLFVWAMILMGFTASILARAKGDGGLSGFMITYLLISAVATMRNPDTVARWLHPGLMILGLGLGALVSTAALLQLGNMIPSNACSPAVAGHALLRRKPAATRHRCLPKGRFAAGKRKRDRKRDCAKRSKALYTSSNITYANCDSSH
jgi:hypothetical protein